MQNSTFVNGLLSDVASRLNIGPLELSDSGTCGLTFRNHIPIVFELPNDSVFLHFHATMVSPIPEKAGAALFERLLKLNHMGIETKGATFAIDDRQNSIVLCYAHALDELNPTVFLNIIENFLSVVDRWHDRLEGAADEEAGPDELAAHTHRHAMLRV